MLCRMLKEGISSKQPPLKVAETRLSLRVHRPGVESCYDNPHTRLVEEVRKPTVDLLYKKNRSERMCKL